MLPRRRLLAGFLILCLLPLAGCWDRQEINDVAFVLASAFDLEDDAYRVTVQIPLPQKVAGGGTGGGSPRPWYVDSATGSTIRDANANQQQAYSRRLFFAHRRVVLVGEELGREGVGPALDILTRVPSNRSTSLLIMTKGPASSLLNIDSPAEQYPAELIREIAQAIIKDPTSVQSFLDTLYTDGIDPMAPVMQLRQTEPGPAGAVFSTAKFGGLAVFRQDKVAGYLSPEDSNAILLAAGQSRTVSLPISPPGDEGQMAVVINTVQSDLQPRINRGRPAILLQVRAGATIQENVAPYQVTAPGGRQVIEEAVNRQLQQQISQAVSRLQTEYRSDALGFGDAFRRKLPREWKHMSARWGELYPEVEVSVQVAVHIEHAGSAVAPAGHPETRLRR